MMNLIMYYILGMVFTTALTTVIAYGVIIIRYCNERINCLKNEEL